MDVRRTGSRASEGPRAADPHAPLTAGDRLWVRLAQATVAVLLVALAAAGRSDYPWPLLTWPVYGMIRPAFPDTTYSVLEVRMRDDRGTVHRLRAPDLVELSRVNIAGDVLEGSVETGSPVLLQQDRAHLARLVRLARPNASFETLQVWRIEWRVDPAARPPLEYGSPDAEVLVAEFVPAPARGLP